MTRFRRVRSTPGSVEEEKKSFQYRAALVDASEISSEPVDSTRPYFNFGPSMGRQSEQKVMGNRTGNCRGWNRRQTLAGLAGAGIVAGLPLVATEHDRILYDINNMLPGDFTWHPDRSPAGAVAIIVSLPEQLVHVYRNGIRIAVSTCSTGKSGHGTPTGVFTILQKDKHHRSSTYNNAPMPNMNRLTWDGVALHAGNLPGFPASDGCVRLPLEFSEKLFTVTHIGTPVIIAGAKSDPWELTHPGLVLGGSAESEMSAAVQALSARSHPSDWDGVADYARHQPLRPAPGRPTVLSDR
ncbi:L,D-transpeptidase family protein [Sedimentitalea sp. JM2-8]|uniref:L,D-transpeptidase family protein n=1 Tax=Sedimentitalea xiamensis TaxID=3050037 RepID=A0ABT7FJC5_9RHOB|nr:L,D-transpeptidase family protein [Sedimentitalea xiamensis]MDK3075247.1 L,D-transpeptidase family protein [Sedimentitalea xiamensis]